MQQPRLVEKNIRNVLCSGLSICHIQNNDFHTFILNSICFLVFLFIITYGCIISNKKENKGQHRKWYHYDENVVWKKIDEYKKDNQIKANNTT